MKKKYTELSAVLVVALCIILLSKSLLSAEANSTNQEVDRKEISILLNEDLDLPKTDDITSLDLRNQQPFLNLMNELDDWELSSVLTEESHEILRDSENNFQYYTLSIPIDQLDRATELFGASGMIESYQVIEWEEGEPNYDRSNFIDSDVKEVNDWTNNPLFYQQTYLQTAPQGIGWTNISHLAGATGAGVSFGLADFGYLLNHEDLVGQPFELLSEESERPEVSNHGTQTIGVIGMRDNEVGGVGIAHAFEKGYLGDPSINSLIAAMDRLDPGDIILIENSFVGSNGHRYPMEINDAWFNVILEATSKDLVVVQPAGNGGNNLDEFVHNPAGRILDRNSLDFRDSGAIMVGAVNSTIVNDERQRANFSTHGSRIDTFAHGVDVRSTSHNINNHSLINMYGWYNGTSSASAIVAGATMSIQGRYRALNGDGAFLSPETMRSLLQTTGTTVRANNQIVGTMVDLEAIFADPEFSEFLGAVTNMRIENGHLHVDVERSFFEGNNRVIFDLNGGYEGEFYNGRIHYAIRVHNRESDQVTIQLARDLSVGDVVRIRLSSGTPGQATNVLEYKTLTVTEEMLYHQ